MTVLLSSLNNIQTHINIFKNNPSKLSIVVDDYDGLVLDKGCQHLINKVKSIKFIGDIEEVPVKCIAPLLNSNDYKNFNYVLNRNLKYSRLERK